MHSIQFDSIQLTQNTVVSSLGTYGVHLRQDKQEQIKYLLNWKWECKNWGGGDNSGIQKKMAV